MGVPTPQCLKTQPSILFPSFLFSSFSSAARVHGRVSFLSYIAKAQNTQSHCPRQNAMHQCRDRTTSGASIHLASIFTSLQRFRTS